MKPKLCPKVCFSLLLAIAALQSAGCQTTGYRAAELPIELQAAATQGAPEVNLAKLAGSGATSSDLAVGDLLHVSVVTGMEDEVTPKPARVRDDGTVSIPLVGTVTVAGMNTHEAGEAIRQASVDRGIYRSPEVTVKIAERAVNYITVLGAVGNPGTHEIPRGSSNLVAAIAAAGGFNEEAGTEVEVLRRGTSFYAGGDKPTGEGVQLASFDAPPGPQSQIRSQRIDLAKVDRVVGGDLSLGDQDVIMVHPKRKRVIHVAGLVRQPNQFEMPDDADLHVLDAVAMAGGRSSAVADKVYVIRQTEGNQQPAVIQVSLSKAKLDGRENLRLAAGDMISVERTFTTNALDAIGNVFRITTGVGGNLVSF